MTFVPASMLATTQHSFASIETCRDPALRAAQIRVLGSAARAVFRSAAWTSPAIASLVALLLTFVQSAAQLLSAEAIAAPLSGRAFGFALRGATITFSDALFLAWRTIAAMTSVRALVKAAG